MLSELVALDGHAEGAPRLEPGRCLRGRFNRTACRRCEEACPKGAIELAAGQLPAVRADACTGCRRCQASCPTGALGDPDELDRAIRELGRRPLPVLGCRAPGVEAHARVSCLGLLDEEGLLALAASFPGGLTLNLVHCGTCSSAAVAPALRRSLERVARHEGYPPGGLRLAETKATLAFAADLLSRRELFSIFRRRSAEAADAAISRRGPAAPEPYAAKRLPAGRRALLKTLPGLTPPVRAAIEAHRFPALSFTAQCRRCTACAGVCPTGAITTGAGEPPRPVFDGLACTSCGVCVEFCRRRGLDLKAPRAAAGGAAPGG